MHTPTAPPQPRRLLHKAGLSLALLAPLGLIALAPPAQAQGPDVTFVLDQTDVTVHQGQTFTFTGSLQNNTNRALTTHDIRGFGLDPTYSYVSTPLTFPSLAPNGSFAGAVFIVDTSQGFVAFGGGQAGPTPVGTYTSFPIIYDFTAPTGSTASSNAQQFVLHVLPPVPEASTTASLGLLLALGVGGLVIARRRKMSA